jgi:tRNA/tmRNA/rRNA uracil-C5-methylase (TrmA/RlmC/RlmD family)
VVATADCLIAVPGSMEAARQALPVVTGDISTAATDDGVVVVDSRGGPIITERAAQRTWRVRASGFWQVHRGAANHFAEVVRDLAAATPGESVLDLYSGAGLFAGALAASVGPAGTITAVESVVSAVRDARRSLSDLGNIELVHADVDAWLRRHQNRKFSIVIADPPRSGLGAANVTLLSGVAQRALVYVSCEPSALARDARTLADSGWQLERLVGIDAFPMTSHVECIALFTPTRAV